MPLMDITNPSVIIFLVENYEKEKRLRSNWIEKHRDKIQEAATLKREAKNWYEADVIAKEMACGMASITREHVNAGFNRRRRPEKDTDIVRGLETICHKHTIVDVGLGDPEKDIRLKRSDTDTSAEPIMRPVNPKVQAIIYKSRPEFGREKYLKVRNKESPENKFYFSQSSNNDYGWRLGDSKNRSKPTNRRCWHLKRAIWSRVGPRPDPPHYNSNKSSGRRCADV